MPSRLTTTALQALAELVVAHPDHGDVADRLVAVKQLLDLLGEDVLAAGDDHVVVAAVDEEAPALVEVADVARGHEAVDDVLAAAARVALEQHLVGHEDPPGLALRDLRPSSSRA